VKRRPPERSSELLSPKAAVGWEAEVEAELIQQVEGLEAATWRSWMRRGWGMQHRVERERVWWRGAVLLLLHILYRKAREREREGERDAPGRKATGRDMTDKDKAHAYFIKKPFYIFYFCVNS
jgi:hypothetical protein